MMKYLSDYTQPNGVEWTELPKVYHWWEVKKDYWPFVSSSKLTEKIEKEGIVPLILSPPSLSAPSLTPSRPSLTPPSQPPSLPPSVALPLRSSSSRPSLSPPSVAPSLPLSLPLPLTPPSIPPVNLSLLNNEKSKAPTMRMNSMVNMKTLLPSPPPSPKKPPPSLLLLPDNSFVSSPSSPKPSSNINSDNVNNNNNNNVNNNANNNVNNNNNDNDNNRNSGGNQIKRREAPKRNLNRTFSIQMPKQSLITPSSTSTKPTVTKIIKLKKGTSIQSNSLSPISPRSSLSPRSSSFSPRSLHSPRNSQSNADDDHDMFQKIRKVDTLLEDLELNNTEVMIADQWAEIRSTVTSLKLLLSDRLRPKATPPSSTSLPPSSLSDPLDDLLENL